MDTIYNRVKYYGEKPYTKKYKKRTPTENEVVQFSHKDGYISENDGSRIYTNVLDGRTKTQFPKSERTAHPTQKPVEVLEVLIKQTTHPGALVVDPFMGSGSTGVAAHNTGRKFIGMEINPEYFQIATDRISKIVEFPEILDCINPVLVTAKKQKSLF